MPTPIAQPTSLPKLLTIKQAAAELMLPLGSVSTLHTRARKHLREIALASVRATLVGRRRAVG